MTAAFTSADRSTLQFGPAPRWHRLSACGRYAISDAHGLGVVPRYTAWRLGSSGAVTELVAEVTREEAEILARVLLLAGLHATFESMGDDRMRVRLVGDSATRALLLLAESITRNGAQQFSRTGMDPVAQPPRHDH